MRKSSLGRRSSSVAGNDSSLAVRPEKRSLLLQPGFSQTKRRASSEDRLSTNRGPTRLFQSVSKSKCDMSLLDYLPQCTPKYFKDNHALPGGSARPSRSQASSMDSNRFSSVGSLKCSKKESRPINDKQFQSNSLKKVQEFFQRQPNFVQILDNSHNVKPMTLKKFINIVDYLLKFIDERTNITKENYIDTIVTASKALNYGGKIERSWLIVVNAPHAWCHVIAFLVWLVDLINLQEIVNDMSEILYPVPLDDVDYSDPLEEDIRVIQPHLCNQFATLASNKGQKINLDSEFDKADDALVEQLLQMEGLTDDEFEALAIEEQNVKTYIENPEYLNEENKMQKQDYDLETVKNCYDSLVEYIQKTKTCIQTKKEEMNIMEKDLELLLINIMEKTQDRDKLRQTVEELKHKVADVSESNKKRYEFQRIINYNEKCIEELSKSLYQIEIATAKLINQMEGPLVEYNNIIAFRAKNEPCLKSCHIDNMRLLNKPGVKEDFAEAYKLLLALKKEWGKKFSEAKITLQELESNYNMMKESESEVLEEYKKKKGEIDSVADEKNHLLKDKEKSIKELQDKIKYYEEMSTQSSDILAVSIEKLDELKKHYEAQMEEILHTIELSELYFTREAEDDSVQEAMKRLIDAYKTAANVIKNRKNCE